MTLKNSMEKFYYQLTLSELRLMSKTNPNDKITYNDALYMDVIALTEDCTASKLADILQVTKPSVTSKVHALEKAGHIVRTKDEIDGRVYHIDLAPVTKEIYEHEDRMTQDIADRLLEKYSEGEIDKFCEILDMVSDLMSKDN